MWKFLLSMNKKLFLAIPVMMSLGFFFGMAASQDTVKSLKLLIVPLTFLMVYPMMVTLNIKHLKDGIKNVKLQVLTQAVNFCLVPFLAYGLGLYFFPDNHYMALGLLLASLLPTSGMTISWTGFAKGNMGAAINMTVIGLTLGALATPFYVKMLMGAKVDMDIVMVVQQTGIQEDLGATFSVPVNSWSPGYCLCRHCSEGSAGVTGSGAALEDPATPAATLWG